MKTNRGGLYGIRNASKSDADNRRDFERWRGSTIDGRRYDEYDPTVYWPGRTNPFMQPQLNFPWNRSLPTPQPIPEPPMPEDPVTRFRQTVASRKIANVIGSKYRARYLNRLCADSGVCFAFGQEKIPLMKFFRFTTFEYTVRSLKRAGILTSNGYILEIKYTREGYNAYAILKSSLGRDRDNLAYEYVVGKYINDHFAPYLPGFIETYGLFKYPSRETQLQVIKEQNPALLTGSEIDPYDPNICIRPDLLCILIQHINGTRLEELITNESFLKQDAVYVFFQVYFTLDILKSQFTHYDLHTGNVLMYEPVVGGYVHYHYHTSSGIKSFKSKYMVKIIDYGRSFFPGSKDYYERICNIRECGDCGEAAGFNSMRRESDLYHEGYIHSLYSNQSHDLRLLRECYELLDEHSAELEDHGGMVNTKFMSNNLFELLFVKYSKPYGTPEVVNTTSQNVLSYLGYSRPISSVSDVVRIILPYITSNASQNDRDYASLRKIGDLHVYSDLKTPMEFIPTPAGGKRTRRSK